MVRIRSDRWYSGENQKKIRRGAPSNSSGTRRVVSLVFLLVLVAVLMQKISNPQNVSNAFRSLGVPLDSEIVDSSHPELLPASAAKSSRSVNSAQNSQNQTLKSALATAEESPPQTDPLWIQTCNDLMPRVLEKATAEQIESLANYLFSSGDSKSRSSNSTTEGLDILPVLKPLQAKLDLAKEVDQQWNERLLQFQTQWDLLLSLSNTAGDQVSDGKQLDWYFEQQLAASLDNRLVSSMRDAAPWIGSETVGFGRLLQRSKGFASAGKNIVHVSSRQLDTEFSKLRGQWVKFRGTVRLVETVKRTQPLLDQPVYYVMWLRGQDQALQPVAVYTAHPIAEKLAQAVETEQFPEVEVMAIVGKKLAYASASGVQVTATLFSDAIVQFASLQPTLRSEGAKYSKMQILLGGALAIVASFMFTIPFWKQMRRGQRSTSSACWMAALLMLASSSNSECWAMLPQSQSSSAQQPPWSRSSDDAERRQFVEQSLQPLFTAALQLQLAETIDGRSIAAPDLVLRTIYAIKQAGWKQLWNSQSFIKLSDEYGLRPVEFEATAWAVQPMMLSEHQQEWFSVQPTASIFRLQVDARKRDLSDSSPTSKPQLKPVFCAQVPSIWKSSAQLRQPVQIRGFELFKRSSEGIQGEARNQAGDKPDDLDRASGTVCFIVDRLAWRLDGLGPDQIQQLKPALPELWWQLATQGWDLAWFDTLAENNKRALSSGETDALLSMLKIASNEANSDPQTAAAKPSLEPIQALQETPRHFGDRLDWTVRLVSATRVILEDKQSYLQFDGFVRLPPSQTIKFDSGKGDGKAVDFKGEFPVTILTTSLPELLRDAATDNAGGGTWKIGKQAQVQGRLFRLWSYESERLKTPTGNGRLVAPLVVASTIVQTHNQPVMNRSGGWWIYLVAMLLVIAASSFIQIRLRSRPRRAKPQ